MEYTHRTPNHIKKWSKENREVSKVLFELAQKGIRSGIYCGTAAEIGVRHPQRDTHMSKVYNVVGFFAGQILSRN